jgi:outer membrane protein assembly factor BamD (BamD/ComL family)
MHEKQAADNLGIAMFYLNKRSDARAAESRLREIVRRHPRYSRLDEVLYQLGVIEYESGRRSEAISTLERLVTEFKLSPRTKDARAELRKYKAGR